MSASNPSGGRIAAENELLAQLGLPPSASPEDVDQLHLAVSQFLAAAPAGVKGWARAQAAALDEAYLTLTDPVGLEGSALRSPTRPPTVVPGGPATPPARRDPVPAIVVATEAAAAASDVEPLPSEVPADAPEIDDTDTDDIDALFASVTPGAHRDLTSGGKPDRAPASKPATAPAYPAVPAAAGAASAAGARKHTRTARTRTAAPVAAPAPTSSGPWKIVAVLASAGLAIVVALFVVVPFIFSLGGSANGSTANNPSAGPSSTAPAVDQAKIAGLMAKIQADPKDTASLKGLGDEFFGGQQYAQAGTFYDQWLAIEPNNIDALLARGATYYNLGDSANAQKLWTQVVVLKPTDKAQAQEVHYDLGFLYMNSATPDWPKVQSEWNQVIAIDATTKLAQTVQQHLDSLVSASLIPASGAPAASGSPAASGATSPAPSGSAGPSGSPAASPVGNVVNEAAKNLAFVNGTLNARANTAFTIHYDNQDAGLPHDMLIKDSSGNTVFKGDMVTGPTAVDYQVPALAAGTYTFTCSIHPTTMNGTLVVGS